MGESDCEIEDLIRQARADSRALGELLERYRPFLMLVGQQQIGPKRAGEEDCSSIVQQTFAEAIQGFARFIGTTEPQFSAWIKSIHRHNILDALRHGRREANLPNDPDDTASFCWWEPAAHDTSPSQRVVKGERALRLAHLLQSLPEMQREAVRLRHLEGWPVEQIAKELDRSISATAGLIKRGLRTLREQVGQESWI